MLTLIKCAQCGRRYEVDSQLGGSRITCTTCGGSVDVPRNLSRAPARDKVLSTLAQAAIAEREAPSTALPRPARSSSQSTPTRTAVRPAPEKLPDAPCPNCGKPLPAWDRVCLVCGYDQSERQVLEPILADKDGFEVPAPVPVRQVRRVRATARYRNPMVDFFDRWIPRTAIPLYTTLLAVLIAWPFIAGAISGTMPGEKAAMQWISIVIVAALAYFVGPLLAGVLGVNLAGKFLCFEVVSGCLSRLLSTALISTAVAAWVIAAKSPGMATHLTGPAAGSTLADAARSAAYVAVITAAVAQFLSFAFLFRLKLADAARAFAFTLLFYLTGGLFWILLLRAFCAALPALDHP